MTIINEDEILSSAIAHYGEPAQVLKCIEELAELQIELIQSLDTMVNEENKPWCHLHQIEQEARCIWHWTQEINQKDITMYDDIQVGKVVSELADVSITTSQMIKLFTTPEEFEKAKQAKLTRLADMISGKYNPGGDCGSIGDDETFEDIHGPVDDKPVQQKAHELMEGGHIGDDSQ